MDYIEFCAIQRTEKLELFQHDISLEDFILYSEQLLPLDPIRKMKLMAWRRTITTFFRNATKIYLQPYETTESVFYYRKFFIQKEIRGDFVVVRQARSTKKQKGRKNFRVDWTNPIVWILKCLNNVRACVREIITGDILYIQAAWRQRVKTLLFFDFII